MSRVRAVFVLVILLASCSRNIHKKGTALWAEEEYIVFEHYDVAFAEFTRLANLGNARAQWNLGEMYWKGHGVAENHTEAMRWYRAAAQQGYANASQREKQYAYEQQQLVAAETARAAEARRLEQSRQSAAAAQSVTAQVQVPAPTPSTVNPPNSGSCVGSAFEQSGVSGYLFKTDNIYGRKITGTYREPTHPGGRPRVELNDGGGIYELWGGGSGAGIDLRMEWWILTTCDGKPIEQPVNYGVPAYTLVLRWLDGYTGNYPKGAYNLNQIVIHPAKIVINGERVMR